MTDTADYWRDVKEFYRERKVKHQRQMPRFVEKLEQSGLKFTRLDRHHFRVYGGGNMWFDYWPSTGLWFRKDQNRRGHGFDALMKAINETHEEKK